MEWYERQKKEMLAEQNRIMRSLSTRESRVQQRLVFEGFDPKYISELTDRFIASGSRRLWPMSRFETEIAELWNRDGL